MTDTTLARTSRARLLARRLTVGVRQARRLARWQLQPAAFGAPSVGGEAPGPVVWERRIPIARTVAAAEQALEAGKARNLALAAPAFDGVALSPGRPLSFWRTLGRVTPAAGYVMGRELRGGCVVPAVGGGICLLSNTLFEAAAWLGWRILERAGHSLEAVPPAPGALWGVEATVFWPHVDLRVASPAPAQLGVRVRDGALEVIVRSAAPVPRVSLWAEDERMVREGDGWVRHNRVVRSVDGGPPEVIAVNRKRVVGEAARPSCLSCEVSGCHARPRRLVLA